MMWPSLQRRFNVTDREFIGCAAAAAVYGAAMAWLVSPVAGLASAWLLFAMALVMLIDSRHLIIPDVLSLPAIPLGLVAAGVVLPGGSREMALDHVLAAALAGAVLLGLRWLFHKIRGIAGLGLGDVKLGAAAGAWLGTAYLHWALLLASLSAVIAVLLRSAVSERGTVTSATKVPFGAFIAPAILILWTVLLLDA